MKHRFMIFVFASLLIGKNARADSSAEAQALFDEGMKLVDAGKVAEGCEKFAASNRVETGFGVLFNLADCHERIGKSASAWAEFREAAGLAKNAGQAERQAKAERRASAVEAKLSRIRIVVPDSESGVVVQQDGYAIEQTRWGQAFPIDPGPHTISVSGPGKKPWSTNVNVLTDGRTSVVKVPAFEPQSERLVTASSDSKLPVRPNNTTPFGTQRMLAVGLAGAGLAGIALGMFFGLSAKSTYDSSAEYCRDGNICKQDGLDLRNSAFTKAAVSTVTFAVSGAALAGGAVLWFVAPSKKNYPQATSGPLVISSGVGWAARGTW